MQGSCPQGAPRLVKEAGNSQIISVHNPSQSGRGNTSQMREYGYSWALTGTSAPLLPKPAGWTPHSPPSVLTTAFPNLSQDTPLPLTPGSSAPQGAEKL